MSNLVQGMIQREAEEKIRSLALGFPAVSVIGPRQSGKTTLVRSVFPQLPYVSLEDPDTRAFAGEDARSFLAQYEKTGAVLDEVQRVPELFSYLQGVLDRHQRPGQFILYRIPELPYDGTYIPVARRPGGDRQTAPPLCKRRDTFPQKWRNNFPHLSS